MSNNSSLRFSTDVIHLEVSTRCTLRCPRCPRTEFVSPWLNKEISLGDFKLFFPPDCLQDIRQFILCGDFGDPIYARDLIAIIQYIKTSKPSLSIMIITNGSYQKDSWWKRLGNSLSNIDMVTFSVDGWDHTSNILYRVNSNFASILSGIKALRGSSDCYIRWSTILFKFNEHCIDEIKDIATSSGCDIFQLVKSTKFDGRYLINGIDSLKPSDEQVSSLQIYEREAVSLTNRDEWKILLQPSIVHPWARCLNKQKEMFVNVEGLVYPCSWFNSGYQENAFITDNKANLSLHSRSLNEIINDPLWEKLYTTSQVEICKIKCKGNQCQT